MTDLHEQMRVIKDLETRLEGERELATVRRQQREDEIETEREQQRVRERAKEDEAERWRERSNAFLQEEREVCRERERDLLSQVRVLQQQVDDCKKEGVTLWVCPHTHSTLCA